MSIITVDLVNYRLNESDHTATVTYSPMASKNIVIPVFVTEKEQEYTVIGIEDFAFRSTGIKTLTFGKGSKVTSFGNSCFAESSLVRITLPPCLSLVGNMWKRGAMLLREIKVTPNNQHYVEENGALYNKDMTNLIHICKDKTSITLPATLQTISKEVLEQNSLQSITISPRNEKYSTESGVLYNKDKTTMILCPKNKISITLPRTLQTIDEIAFKGCSQLTSISLPSTNQYFSVQHGILFDNKKTTIFYCERNKAIVKIPNSVEVVSGYAFSGCSNLETVTFQDNSKLNEIQIFAFSHTSIKSIEIPQSVKHIEEGAFASCKQLKIFTFQENSQIENIEKFACASTPIDTITFPPSLKTIGSYSLAGCRDLRSIIFTRGSQLENIEEGAFADSSIEEIEIPPNVKVINESTFLNCEKLKTIKFSPESKVESFEKCSFSLPLLEEITIPKTVKHIGIGAFADSRLLKSIKFEEGSELEVIEQDAFCCCGIESIEIPEGVTFLTKGSFLECPNLHSAKLLNREKVTLEHNVFRGVADDFVLTIFDTTELCGVIEIPPEKINKIKE